MSATASNIIDTKINNPVSGNNSKYSPPKIGPLRLPKLKKIPHNKFPVGNNSFGVKSAIYVIPNENIDPAHIPAIKNTPATSICEYSSRFPTKKKALPASNPPIISLRRPILSPSAPSGNCIVIAPTEKQAKIIDTNAKSKSFRSAYTGNNAFNEDSKKPYISGGKNAIHPYLIANL